MCGLRFSPDEQALASGGNDNRLCVWDIATVPPTSAYTPAPRCVFTEHVAAVKAVAWSPHTHGLLASGGGTADRHIRFWNTRTAAGSASGSASLHSVHTGSQVCSLMWSPAVNELISTHGYSLNQCFVWRYPSMQKLATLSGHTTR